MKYIGIENADSEKLVMHMACKKCDAELTGLEKFCPQCGRKLDKKEKGIPLMKAVELLNPLRSEATMKAEDKLTQLRNCDRFNTGDAEADYATAIKKYREETGKVVYNACPRYDSVGDFIIWMLSGKSLANGTIDGTLHQEGKETK